VSSQLKSPQTPPGSPSQPTYLEFIIFALLALIGVTAMVVFLAKRSEIPVIAQADSVTTQDEPNSIPHAESDENADQAADAKVADPSQAQLSGTATDVIDTPEVVQQPPDRSSAKVKDAVADGDATAVSTAHEPAPDSAALKTYSLAATGQDGSVTRSPDQASYTAGETVTLEAIPNTGYRFSNWTGDLSGSTNPTTLVMDASKSVRADFTLQAYSLTISALDGFVTKSPDRASYRHGETVTLEASANSGYTFTHWLEDLSGNTNPVTLIMDSDKLVRAGFSRQAYSLTVAARDGSVTKSPAQASYRHGVAVTLQAQPNTGYSFRQWTGDLSGNTNPTALVMDANKSVTASFGLKTYSLAAFAGDGSVVMSPAQASYHLGEKVILAAVPNLGYSFTHWSGDLAGSTNPTTLIMDGDKSVRASFALTAKTSDVVTNSIGMKLVYVPAGSFMMGSGRSATQLAEEYDEAQARFEDEVPQHPVRISTGFWMGQTEVTQGQYQSVMNTQPWSGKAYVQIDANNPAVYVSWDDAQAFCRKLTQQEGTRYRLPTEAEWEYACRAGTTTRFSFSDSDLALGDYAWFDGNTDDARQDYAHLVGQKKSNPWGLYDMHGNVLEWCSDYYDEKYYANSPSVDPNGPASGISHTVRGGAWDHGLSYLRSAYRSDYPVSRGLLVGFRVVSDGQTVSDGPALPIVLESDVERPKTGDDLVQTQDDAPITVKTQEDVKVTVQTQDDTPIAAKVQEDTPVIVTTQEDAQAPVKVPAKAPVTIDTERTLIDISGNAYDRLDKAAVAARMGQAPEAQAALKSLLADKDVAVLAGYESGLIHYENGEVDKAIPLFKDALSAAFPGPASGKDETVLSALLNQEEDAARIRYELGLICQSQGKQGQAAKLFRDGLCLISAKGATYIGVKKCKSCHFKQWNSWRKTKMAQTFEVLKPGVRSEEKAKLKFDPEKDYTRDASCLECHTSGYGLPGGYIVPAEGDAQAKGQAADNAGVTCEGCHGPGSKATAILEDIKENKRTYTFAELRAVGFHKAGVRSCTPCHNTSDPGKEPGYHFDYNEERKEDQHENLKLKYRRE